MSQSCEGAWRAPSGRRWLPEHPPPHSLSFSTSIKTKTSAAENCRLAVDLRHLKRVDNRLRSWRWLDLGAPRAGARAEVETAVSFRLPWVQRAVEPQQGIVTLSECDPPYRLGYALQTQRGTALLAVDMIDYGHGQGCCIAISGWIFPHGTVQRYAIRGLSAILRPRIEASVRKMVVRATEIPISGSP